MTRLGPVCGLLLVGVASVAGQQSPVTDAFQRQFKAELERITGDSRAVVGVQTIDLTDSTAVGVQPDFVFPQASAIKVPILIELFRRGDGTPGLLRQKRSVDAATRVGGSGVIGRFTDQGSDLSLEDLAILMVVLSDNTATNLLIDELGMENINKTLSGLGFRQTWLRRKMMRSEGLGPNDENTSTPAEAATIMRRLAACELPLAAESCKRVREILEMPKDDPFRDAIPGGVRVAFKPGYTDSCRTAWALVDLPGRPYAAAVMITFTSNGISGDGADIMRAVSRACYEHFARLANANPYGVRRSPPKR